MQRRGSPGSKGNDPEMEKKQGVARAKEIYESRDRRARELKAQGKKTIGYFCCYGPQEMMTAAGWFPYRILGKAAEPITEADAYLETTLCSFIRSCFDIGMKGQLDFLDGLVGVHACDNMEKCYDIFRHYLKPSFSFFVDVPHVAHPASYRFFRDQLNFFKKRIEKFNHCEISTKQLEESIRLHNENRALVRKLYSLRQEDPPLLTGTEVLQTMVAVLSLPVEESNELLTEVIQEVKKRRERPPKKKARILVWGGPIDNTALVQLIEDCGANVVMDDTCVGSRHFWADVQTNKEPLEALTVRYLDKILCPRTFWDSTETYRGDLEKRFNYLRNYAREYKVNGAILQHIRFCDTHAYEAPNVRDYLQEAGIPVLYLEHDYSVTALAPFQTRIQAFLEMIG